MVVLGKGHCDAQTLVPSPLSESRCRLLGAPDALASRTEANMKSQLKSNAKNIGHARAEIVVVVVSDAAFNNALMSTSLEH